MARRRVYTLRRNCAADGCREFEFYEYRTKRDYGDARKRFNDKPYYCNRHDPDGENLSPKNLIREVEYTLIADRSEEYPNLDSLFWYKDGTISSGFIFGDGWNAYADDFPAGTKIVVHVRAEIQLPVESSGSRARQ